MRITVGLSEELVLECGGQESSYAFCVSEVSVEVEVKLSKEMGIGETTGLWAFRFSEKEIFFWPEKLSD